jgi:hypothetical protein
VRAGSSLSWFGDRLALIQDDANFLVLIEPHSLQVDPIPLPAGEGGRHLCKLLVIALNPGRSPLHLLTKAPP